MGEERRTTRVDYGQDIPEMVRDSFLLGGVLAALGVFLRLWPSWRQSTSNRLVSWLGLLTLGLGALSTLEALLVIWSSRVAKLWIAEGMLDRLGLRGDEMVLDVGCGHGTLLIPAAKRLPRGRAVGVDIWRNFDQGGNSRDATLRNARLEGVTDRIELYDADMRELPLVDGSVDHVVASLAVHNIDDREGRRQALSEIVRVLKPGGKVVLMDIFHVYEYSEDLRALGMQEVCVSGRNFLHYYPARIVTGRKA
jgi:arsenite methyltransferase